MIQLTSFTTVFVIPWNVLVYRIRALVEVVNEHAGSLPAAGIVQFEDVAFGATDRV